MTAEISELDQLAAKAAALDAQPAPDMPAAVPEKPKADVAGEVAALLKMVAGMLAPAFPSLATIYTDATCNQLGQAAAPVMDKYGVSVGGLFDRWGAEFTLAATALPVALATYQGIKADLVKKTPAPNKASSGGTGHQNLEPEPIPAGALVIPPINS